MMHLVLWISFQLKEKEKQERVQVALLYSQQHHENLFKMLRTKSKTE